MRAGDERERRLSRNWIHRQPHTRTHSPFNVVVRLILVPGRALTGTGFLDEQMIVIEPHDGRVHQLRGDRSRARVEDQIAIFRNALPVAEILEEEARIVGRARNLGMGAWRAQVDLDAPGRAGKLGCREQPSNANSPIPYKRCFVFLGHRKVRLGHDSVLSRRFSTLQFCFPRVTLYCTRATACQGVAQTPRERRWRDPLSGRQKSATLSCQKVSGRLCPSASASSSLSSARSSPANGL